MTRKVLNFLIVFFEPSLMIPRRDWLALWKEGDRNSYLLWSRVLCFGIAVIYLLHYPLVDIPAKKEPLQLWFNYRISVATVALLAFSSSWIKSISRSTFNKIPAYFAIAFTVYMQGQSMIWRQQVPFFYVPLFGFIGSFALRLSPGKSVLTFLSLMAIAYEPFVKRPDDTQHLLSATIVTSVLLMIFRSHMKTEVKGFILENEQSESNKKLIQAQLEMTEQMRAFLPKMIYLRVNELIQNKRRTPLQAVDEVLRPRKITGAVFFSDIRGFTGLTKAKGDEAALTAIIPAQKICTDIVEKFSGIPRLQGDLVYAYFDSPNADENVINALKAAVSVAHSTMALNVRNKDKSITRYMIITFGDLIVGNLGGTEGSRDISVLGDSANLPSRIDPITKLPEIKPLLESAPIIVTKEALEAAKRQGLALNVVEIKLEDYLISLRDFEEVRSVFLVPEKEFKKIHEFINETSISNFDRMAA